MTDTATGTPLRPGRGARKTARDPLKHGFYGATFTSEEVRRLDAGDGDIRDEMKLLRTKVLRLAKLTPLRTISDKELDTLIKLIRVVAAIDLLERTRLMRLKMDADTDPAFEALAALDSSDL